MLRNSRSSFVLCGLLIAVSAALCNAQCNPQPVWNTTCQTLQVIPFLTSGQLVAVQQWKTNCLDVMSTQQWSTAGCLDSELNKKIYVDYNSLSTLFNSLSVSAVAGAFFGCSLSVSTRCVTFQSGFAPLPCLGSFNRSSSCFGASCETSLLLATLAAMHQGLNIMLSLSCSLSHRLLHFNVGCSAHRFQLKQADRHPAQHQLHHARQLHLCQDRHYTAPDAHNGVRSGHLILTADVCAH